MLRHHATCPACAVPIGAQKYLAPAALGAAEFMFYLQKSGIAEFFIKRRHGHGFMMAAALAPDPKI